MPPLPATSAYRVNARSPRLGSHADLAARAAGANDDGWKVSASWENETLDPIADAIRRFDCTLRVPVEPVGRKGQLIYLFHGLAPSCGEGILQPVLQWGVSPAGGGEYWSIASWYAVGGSRADSTEPIPVAAGTVLRGKIAMTGGYDDRLDYRCEFDGYPASVLLVRGIGPLTKCHVALEAYAVGDTSRYPATPAVRFDDLRVDSSPHSPPFSWIPHRWITTLGEGLDIVTDSAAGGRVDVLWR